MSRERRFCPQCASFDIILARRYYNDYTAEYWCRCYDCGYEGPACNTESEAQEAWNDISRLSYDETVEGNKNEIRR